MIYKTPKWIHKLFSWFVWRVPTKEKILYLTFDDGPIPVVTEFVLDELKNYNAKATFFCIGDNVRKNPEIFNRILNEGHAVGNHTYNHLNGWKSNNNNYFENVEKCDTLIKSKLFRPPFGKIKKSQYTHLVKEYKIVMWTVLTWDFLKNLDQRYTLKTVLSQTKRGDIVVFHDSLKAEHNIKYLLPKWLKYFADKGFVFEALDQNKL